jgi:hypothetical protein
MALWLSARDLHNPEAQKSNQADLDAEGQVDVPED